jgi:hypothetical protein
MRRLIIVTVIAAGAGFIGASAGSAAPVNATVLKQAATMNDLTIKVQHWRWGSRWGHPRCHGWRSGWHWC